MLEDKKLALRWENQPIRRALQRIAFAIRTALNELGHPEASVKSHARKRAMQLSRSL